MYDTVLLKKHNIQSPVVVKPEQHLKMGQHILPNITLYSQEHQQNIVLFLRYNNLYHYNCKEDTRNRPMKDEVRGAKSQGLICMSQIKLFLCFCLILSPPYDESVDNLQIQDTTTNLWMKSQELLPCRRTPQMLVHVRGQFSIDPDLFFCDPQWRGERMLEILAAVR